MLDSPWHFLAVAIVSLALFYAVLKLTFAAWFAAKERFVDRLHKKMVNVKGRNNAQD